MDFKFVDQINEDGDEARIIESTKTVEQTERFTINQLKSQVVSIDSTIASLTKEKADILDKIAETSNALNINLKEIV